MPCPSPGHRRLLHHNTIDVTMWKSGIHVLLVMLVASNFLFASSDASCSTGAHASLGGVAKAADGNNYQQVRIQKLMESCADNGAFTKILFHLPQGCINAIRTQVRKEFEASLQYMLMGKPQGYR